MRKMFSAIIATILLIPLAYCQDMQNLIGEVTKVYSGNKGSGNELIAGFSLAGLLGGILFGSIGFVAFVYGKKNSGFKKMFMGVLLMAYPYLVRNTTAIYVIGIILTVVLFVWRE